MKNQTERFFVKIACLLFAFGAATFSAACENSDNGAINGQQGGKTETQTSLVQLISSFETKTNITNSARRAASVNSRKTSIKAT